MGNSRRPPSAGYKARDIGAFTTQQAIGSGPSSPPLLLGRAGTQRFARRYRITHGRVVLL